jgi:hydrogenase expression/formation protein HypE
MSKITLAHGAGGKETTELLEDLIFSRVENRFKKVEGGLGIDHPDDSALIPIGNGRFLVISTDSYTVSPIFFPGGDIGKLAVCGSINDVLVMGGFPIAMLDTIVVEEGFPIDTLKHIIDSMVETLTAENVALIGGDFKVMPRGHVDKIVISTTGIGISEKPIVDLNIQPGNRIIVSGCLGEHGATIMALQHGLNTGALKSDVKSLTGLFKPLMMRFPNVIKAAGDPTRGGLSMLLNNWAKLSGNLIYVDESKIPLREPVRKYSEMLGVDPLHLASEGVAVLAVDGNVAEEILEFVRSLGFSDAAIVGEVRRNEEFHGLVIIRSEIGGLRVLEPPTGEIVPRIC